METPLFLLFLLTILFRVSKSTLLPSVPVLVNQIELTFDVSFDEWPFRTAAIILSFIDHCQLKIKRTWQEGQTKVGLTSDSVIY